MESFGTYLKNVREARKISLGEISRATKIRRAVLEAIERDQRGGLPEVVVKGFIETYARYIGLDPEETLSKYSQWQRGNKAGKRREFPLEEKREIPKEYIFAGAIGLVIILIGSFLFFPGRVSRGGAEGTALKKDRSGQKRMVSSKGLQSIPSVAEQTPLPSSSVDAQAAKTESSAMYEHTLVITASERTWIQIQEGSSLPLDVILYSGDSYTRKSSRQFVVLIGNASGVQVTFDGKSLGSLGGVGEVVKFKLPSLEEG